MDSTIPPAKPRLSASLIASLRAAYFEMDPRSLGLFRILFGVLLLFDLLRHVRGFGTWFPIDGVIPPSVVESMERGRVPLSIFLALPSLPVFAIGFVAIGLVYAAYTVGYRTDVARILVIVALVTLHGRAGVIERSGERSLHLFAILTAFLPLGARFSIDALRARRTDREATTLPVRSFAVAAILLQLAVIYALDWAIKRGQPAWREGTALLGAIQSMTGTGFGLFVRDRAPRDFFRVLTVLTLMVESVLPALLLLPISYIRVLAALMMAGLHFGIWTFMNLGVFQPAMIVPAALLITPDIWNWLERTPRLARPRAAIGRLAARLTSWIPPSSGPPSRPRPVVGVLREVTAVILFACLVPMIQADNPILSGAHPNAVGVALHRVFARVGVFESWEHFNNPRLEDAILAVDAVTRDGRHVDPLNRAAFGYVGPPLTEVPHRADMSIFWWNYEKVVRDPHSPLLPSLEAWIERYPARTGNADDEITSYEITRLETRRDLDGAPIETTRTVLARCDRGCR